MLVDVGRGWSNRGWSGRPHARNQGQRSQGSDRKSLKLRWTDGQGIVIGHSVTIQQ